LRLILVALAATFLVCIQGGCVRNRIYESESPALERIRQLPVAEAEYRKTHGRYADLAELTDTASGAVAGYQVTIQASRTEYKIAANRPATDLPYRSFYADQTGVIRYSFATGSSLPHY
jgi:hypothetical protein